MLVQTDYTLANDVEVFTELSAMQHRLARIGLKEVSTIKLSLERLRASILPSINHAHFSDALLACRQFFARCLVWKILALHTWMAVCSGGKNCQKWSPLRLKASLGMPLNLRNLTVTATYPLCITTCS
jgi:hypothetical protein